MSEDQRHPVYAATYTDKFKAVSAARALFAEVYDLLLKKGFEVEVRPFEPEKPDDVPQIHRLNGLELHDGGYQPIISFGVESKQLSFSNQTKHTLEVKFEPGYSYKKTQGFDQLVTVSRNPSRTPNGMGPQSICEFIVKYADAVHKRQVALDERKVVDILKQARLNANEKHAKELRERPEKGRAYVFASRDTPVYGENEVWLQLRGTPEEIRRACELLDREFPLPQTKTSGE